MANLSRGGFRWRINKGAPASVSAPVRIFPVASAYATALYRGDPVKLASTGTIQAAAPGDRVIGIFEGAEQYWDGSVMRKGAVLPASTTYGSNLARQSLVRVIEARGQIFEVDADDAVTFTTQATYQAAVGENCEWVTGTPSGEQSGALLDISTHNTTATLSCRILDIPSQGSLQDFASAGVKLHVEFNLTQDTAAGTTTGV
jgi:hypothetical protein